MSSFDQQVSESAIHYPLQLPASRWRAALKLILGRLLLTAMPRQGESVLHSGDPMAFTALQRLLVAGHLERARRTGDWDALTPIQSRFWAGRGGQLFNSVQGVADRFQTWFLGPHQAVVDALAEQIGDGSGWQGLTELGSGNGLALDFLSRRFPALPMLTGVDLNGESAAANSARYNNPRLRFVAAEACDWVRRHAEGGQVWFSNAGVLEYLSESQVLGIYQALAQAPGASVFALVEPIEQAHDLARQAGSIINTLEHSHSHNHPALLQKTGWSLRYQQETTVIGLRWLMVVAVKNNP
ncbi:MAG: class I SAM-dependent methyltransferase [Pseudomonadota bacterium]